MTHVVASGRRRGFRRTSLRYAIALSLLMTVAGVSQAQTSRPAQDFDIPAGTLVDALNRFGEQSGLQVSYDLALLKGKRAPAVKGHLSADAALEQLLQGAGLGSRYFNDRTIIINRADKPPSPAQPASTAASKPNSSASVPATTELDQVTVTGTRIRGGSTPSPTITIGSERIAEEGFSDLGEVIRSIPQNFTGGQNPGIGSGATGGGVANQNITGGSGLNLRGLGQDASLTLLNGRRMSYGGYVQMVDISAIPVEAVERIDIVPDGASAIYGSDAVGGVGNVILKREFDGVTVGARYGGATDGGLNTREYSATAGTVWSTGGVIATWIKTSNDPIKSYQRGYTQSMYDPATIYPSNDLHSGLFSGHQSLGDNAELRLDALRTEREMSTSMAYATNYYLNTPKTITSLISPNLEFSLSNSWTLLVGATWGKDETLYHQSLVTTASSRISSTSQGCYCNESRSYEVGAEGPLLVLPGGEARLAVGAGYRTNEYQQQNSISRAISNNGDESSRFAYAEINVPLIGTGQNIEGVRRLELTAAMRGEDYDSFGSVTTPKVGIIYDPSVDFTLKVSWGKSFKAPTLLQRYQVQNAYLYPATMFGATGYTSDATALYLVGGNRELKPERARTWSASLSYHPITLSGLEMELTWFDIDFTDRVAQPLINTQALSNPIYADFINYSPTIAEQADILANYTFYNYAGDYNASKVVAIVPNLYINTSRQQIKGLDLSGSYRFNFGSGRLTLRGSTSWLDSTQQTTAAQSAYDLAGTLFYPAKISSRFGTVWNQGGLSASIFGNYKSGVTHTTDGKKSASFITFDSTIRYAIDERSDWLSGLTFELSAQNLFNRAPPLYVTTSLTNLPYDSTNYSAIGRYLTLSMSKHF